MASVLIVDDSSFMRNVLRYIIEGGGHTVVGDAVNGEQAVTLYKSLQPEVVTLDFLMEGENGLEALKAILQHDSSARVIMISAVEYKEVKDRSLACGARSFIEKPPVPGQVLSEIDRVLSG